MYAQRGDDIEKKTGKKKEKNREKKTKKKNREDDRSEKTEKRTKKKPRTEGGETKKRRRRRAFFSRCLHYYLHLRFQLHQVKSYSSLCFCVIVARKQCEGNLITFALCSARVG